MSRIIKSALAATTCARALMLAAPAGEGFLLEFLA